MWYFAYGSNMDLDRMIKRISRKPLAKAGCLEGYCLTFSKKASGKNGVGYANVEEKSNENVHGVLYDLTAEEIIKLDGYEGVPEHYEKKKMIIKSEGNSVIAIVYVANKKQVVEGLLPERSYLEHLLKGREYLPAEYYEKLKKQKTID